MFRKKLWKLITGGGESKDEIFSTVEAPVFYQKNLNSQEVFGENVNVWTFCKKGTCPDSPTCPNSATSRRLGPSFSLDVQQSSTGILSTAKNCSEEIIELPVITIKTDLAQTRDLVAETRLEGIINSTLDNSNIDCWESTFAVLENSVSNPIDVSQSDDKKSIHHEELNAAALSAVEELEDDESKTTVDQFSKNNDELDGGDDDLTCININEKDNSASKVFEEPTSNGISETRKTNLSTCERSDQFFHVDSAPSRGFEHFSLAISSAYDDRVSTKVDIPLHKPIQFDLAESLSKTVVDSIIVDKNSERLEHVSSTPIAKNLVLSDSSGNELSSDRAEANRRNLDDVAFENNGVANEEIDELTLLIDKYLNDGKGEESFKESTSSSVFGLQSHHTYNCGSSDATENYSENNSAAKDSLRVFSATTNKVVQSANTTEDKRESISFEAKPVLQSSAVDAEVKEFQAANEETDTTPGSICKREDENTSENQFQSTFSRTPPNQIWMVKDNGHILVVLSSTNSRFSGEINTMIVRAMASSRDGHVRAYGQHQSTKENHQDSEISEGNKKNVEDYIKKLREYISNNKTAANVAEPQVPSKSRNKPTQSKKSKKTQKQVNKKEQNFARRSSSHPEAPPSVSFNVRARNPFQKAVPHQNSFVNLRHPNLFAGHQILSCGRLSQPFFVPHRIPFVVRPHPPQRPDPPVPFLHLSRYPQRADKSTQTSEYPNDLCLTASVDGISKKFEDYVVVRYPIDAVNGGTRNETTTPSDEGVMKMKSAISSCNTTESLNIADDCVGSNAIHNILPKNQTSASKLVDGTDRGFRSEKDQMLQAKPVSLSRERFESNAKVAAKQNKQANNHNVYSENISITSLAFAPPPSGFIVFPHLPLFPPQNRLPALELLPQSVLALLHVPVLLPVLLPVCAIRFVEDEYYSEQRFYR